MLFGLSNSNLEDNCSVEIIKGKETSAIVSFPEQLQTRLLNWNGYVFNDRHLVITNLQESELEEKRKEEKPREHFRKPWRGSDVVIVVDREEFHTHTYIIESSSPPLAAMLCNGNFKEGKEKRASLIGKDKTVMCYFLHCMYPGSQLPEPFELDGDKEGIPFLTKVLEYAEEYLVDYVRIRIEEYFMAKFANLSTKGKCVPSSGRSATLAYALADQFNLLTTKGMCLRFLAKIERVYNSNNNNDHYYTYDEAFVKQLSLEAKYDLVAMEMKKSIGAGFSNVDNAKRLLGIDN